MQVARGIAPVQITVLTVLASILPACGGTTSNHGGPQIVTPVFTPHPPATYTLDDPGCQSSVDAPVSLTATTINAWVDGHVVPQNVALHDTQSAASLTSPTVTETRYHDVYTRVCDLALPDGHWCDGSDGVEKGWGRNDQASPGALRICKDGHAYGRQSFEGVALTSSYFMQHARDRYIHVTHAAGAPAPAAIGLTVLPDFIDYYDHYTAPDGQTERLERFLTHNLAYFPEAKMVTVFPERADAAATEAGFFWESEFVLSHEYGHHIDFTRHGKVLSAIGLRWNPRTHGYDDLTAQGEGLDGPSDRSQIAGAMAEAFADMMAYYAGGASNKSLKGIPDIGVNRDVGGATFDNGDSKVLTPERLNILLGLASDTSHDGGSPTYSDIHIVGAIIAHTANQVFLQLTGADAGLALGSADEVDQRYRLALSYMDTVVQQTATLTTAATGAAVLAPISQALAKTTDDYLSGLALTGGASSADKFRQEVCRIARQQLPAMDAPPFAVGTGC